MSCDLKNIRRVKTGNIVTYYDLAVAGCPEITDAARIAEIEKTIAQQAAECSDCPTFFEPQCVKYRKACLGYDNGRTPGSSSTNGSGPTNFIRFDWVFESTGILKNNNLELVGDTVGPYASWTPQLQGWADLINQCLDGRTCVAAFGRDPAPTWRYTKITCCNPTASFGPWNLTRDNGDEYTLYPVLDTEEIVTAYRYFTIDCSTGEKTVHWCAPTEAGGFEEIEAPTWQPVEGGPEVPVPTECWVPCDFVFPDFIIGDRPECEEFDNQVYCEQDSGVRVVVLDYLCDGEWVREFYLESQWLSEDGPDSQYSPQQPLVDCDTGEPLPELPCEKPTIINCPAELGGCAFGASIDRETVFQVSEGGLIWRVCADSFTVPPGDYSPAQLAAWISSNTSYTAVVVDPHPDPANPKEVIFYILVPCECKDVSFQFGDDDPSVLPAIPEYDQASSGIGGCAKLTIGKNDDRRDDCLEKIKSAIDDCAEVVCKPEVTIFDSSNTNTDAAVKDPDNPVWLFTPDTTNLNTSVNQAWEQLQGGCAAVLIYVEETISAATSGWIFIPASAVTFGTGRQFSVNETIQLERSTCSDAEIKEQLNAISDFTYGDGTFQQGPMVPAEIQTLAFDTPPDGTANGRCLTLVETEGELKPTFIVADKNSGSVLSKLCGLFDKSCQSLVKLCSIEMLLDAVKGVCISGSGSSSGVTTHTIEDNNTDFSFSYNGTTLKLQGQNPFNSSTAQPAHDAIHSCIADDGTAKITFTDQDGNQGYFEATGVIQGAPGDNTSAFDGIGDVSQVQNGKVRTMVVDCCAVGEEVEVLQTSGCNDADILSKLCQIEANTTGKNRIQVLQACDKLADDSLVDIFIKYTFVQCQPVLTELFSDVQLTQTYNGNTPAGQLVDCNTGEPIEEPEPLPLDSNHVIEGCIEVDGVKVDAYTIVNQDGKPLFDPRPLSDLGFVDCCNPVTVPE